MPEQAGRQRGRGIDGGGSASPGSLTGYSLESPGSRSRTTSTSIPSVAPCSMTTADAIGHAGGIVGRAAATLVSSRRPGAVLHARGGDQDHQQPERVCCDARFLPTIFFAASVPCVVAGTGAVLTLWESITLAVGAGSRPSAIRLTARNKAAELLNAPSFCHRTKYRQYLGRVLVAGGAGRHHDLAGHARAQVSKRT